MNTFRCFQQALSAIPLRLVTITTHTVKQQGASNTQVYLNPLKAELFLDFGSFPLRPPPEYLVEARQHFDEANSTHGSR